MKTALIIISHNQSSSLSRMLDAVRRLDVDRYWVLDRCEDASEDILKSLGEGPGIIINRDGEGFLAGKMRDLGIDAALKAEALSQEPYDVFVFLDGDRIPVKPLTQATLARAYRRWDVALSPLQADSRPLRPGTTAKDFEPNQFISCGFIIKAEVVRMIRQLPFMEDRLFHKVFDGVYGYEDCFLGKLLLDMGCSIGWSTIVVRGGIVFDDFSKMSTLLEQAIRYDTLSRQFSVRIEDERNNNHNYQKV